MSRFLGCFRRLRQKLARLEKVRGVGSLPDAMIEHALTGKLPEHPGQRKQLLRHLRCAQAMCETVPAPGQGDCQPCRETLSTKYIDKPLKTGE
jgi:hypothetical protein